MSDRVLEAVDRTRDLDVSLVAELDAARARARAAEGRYEQLVDALGLVSTDANGVRAVAPVQVVLARARHVVDVAATFDQRARLTRRPDLLETARSYVASMEAALRDPRRAVVLAVGQAWFHSSPMLSDDYPYVIVEIDDVAGTIAVRSAEDPRGPSVVLTLGQFFAAHTRALSADELVDDDTGVVCQLCLGHDHADECVLRGVPIWPGFVEPTP